MRNSIRATIALTIFLLCGCGADNNAKQELTEGYSSLDARQYDQAISRADAFLQKTPAGPGSAEALYLRGRALEQKPAHSSAEASSNLQGARESYIQALSQNPSPKLEAYIHTSLANVAYFQDDYASAANEWTIAYDKLDDPTIKAWALYRIGLCRQRMGQFNDADKIFATVEQRFPNTVQSQRAHEHAGVRGFTLQLATFAAGPSADNAIQTLRREGVLARKLPDAKGRSVLVVGPLGSYQQAQSIKTRYATKYPDAMIVP